MIAEGAGHGRPAITRTWIIPFGVLSGLIAAAVGGLLSRALFLDLVAWWPVWLGLVGLGRLARDRRFGKIRAPGLVAILGLILVVIFAIAHIQGWRGMPSAAGRLVGPTVGDISEAALTANIGGTLLIDTNSTFLYQVIPIRRGGPVGIPKAVENTIDGSRREVNLEVPAEPGLQAFAGWNIGLSSNPAWTLDLHGVIKADLSAIDIDALVFSGQGEITLGNADGLTDLAIDGNFTLTFPSAALVRVIGDAQVPPGWERLEDGWRSPLAGDGWTVTVSPGSTLTIRTPS